MTALATSNGDDRAAAVAAWQEAAAAGERMTGRALGERFGRSPRWGRDRIGEARTAAAATGGAAGVAPRQADGEAQPTDVLELAGPVGQPAGDPQRRPWYDSFIVLVVAAVAAAASYGHMAHVAALAGEPGWIAHLTPITVDGLVLAALRRGEQGRPWLLLGLAVSVGANVLAQCPDLAADVGPLVSAWPPLALYGTHRLLHRR